MNIWLAALAAVLIQPLVLLLRFLPGYVASPGPLHGLGFLLIAVVAVAAAVVLILGVPVFLLLRRYQRVGWRSLALAGALLGGSLAVFSWPREIEGYSAGHSWHGRHVDTYIDGIPTTYAWLTYGENVLFFALHGLIGALVFYAVWRRQEGPNNSLKRTNQSLRD
jgi:hypothetical protein